MSTNAKSKKSAQKMKPVYVQSELAKLGEAIFETLPKMPGARPPGTKCLVVLAEIFREHLDGKLWFPNGAPGQFGFTVVTHRAGMARLLRDEHKIVKGSAQQGYMLVTCPRCNRADCVALACKRDPRPAKKKRRGQVAVHQHPVRVAA